MMHVNHQGIANIFEPLGVMMKNIVNKKNPWILSHTVNKTGERAI
jgi:hypothetical protein